MAAATFTVPTTAIYTSLSTGARVRYHVGDVIALALAIDLQMPGATAPAATTPFDVAKDAWLETRIATLIATEGARLRMGLRDPNPGIARITDYPAVMASPPTITLSAAGAATAISGAVARSNTFAAFRYFGTAPALVGGGGANAAWYMPTAKCNTWSVDFMFDGSLFELPQRGQNMSWRLWVDGQPSTLTTHATPAADGLQYYSTVDFGSRARRHIRIEFGGANYFGGIRVGPGDSVRICKSPRGPRLIELGDSFPQAVAGITGAYNGYVSKMGILLGIVDAWPSGWGGTSWLNPGSGRTTIGDRMQADCFANAPDIIVFSPGLNDINYNPGTGIVTPAQVGAEAARCVGLARAANPAAPIIVHGGWVGSSGGAGQVATQAAAMKPLVLASGADLWIDSTNGTWQTKDGRTGDTGGAWLFGSGKSGTTAGDGNADYYRYTDGTHPTLAGHDYYADCRAAVIAAALPL